MTDKRIAAIGDATSVAGFRLLGFAVYTVEQPEAARELWPDVLRGEYAAVFVTEPVYPAIADLVAETADLPFPAVTVIPSTDSPGGMGAAKLDRAIERALGTTVPFREEEDV